MKPMKPFIPVIPVSLDTPLTPVPFASVITVEEAIAEIVARLMQKDRYELDAGSVVRLRGRLEDYSRLTPGTLVSNLMGLEDYARKLLADLGGSRLGLPLTSDAMGSIRYAVGGFQKDMALRGFVLPDPEVRIEHSRVEISFETETETKALVAVHEVDVSVCVGK